MENFTILGRIGEGAQGIVLKARNKDGELVALKKIPLRKLSDGIPNTALREIKALQSIAISPYVVRLHDVFSYGTGFVLVFDFMMSDLSEIIRNCQSSLTEAQSKAYMLMLLRGVEVMHLNGIMHRDLKPANLLISSKGILKIADFGLARVFDCNNKRFYSHQVATRWYRAPELLYGAKKYTNSVDLWAIGCIFSELLNGSPLFPGENDIEQLWYVVRTLGTPNKEEWPGVIELPDYNKITFNLYETIPLEEILFDLCPKAIDLIQKFIVYPPHKRISATEALKHEYFYLDPLPVHQNDLFIPKTKNTNLVHIQPSYEHCLTDPFDSILVNRALLKEGSHYLNNT